MTSRKRVQRWKRKVGVSVKHAEAILLHSGFFFSFSLSALVIVPIATVVVVGDISGVGGVERFW